MKLLSLRTHEVCDFCGCPGSIATGSFSEKGDFICFSCCVEGVNFEQLEKLKKQPARISKNDADKRAHCGMLR